MRFICWRSRVERELKFESREAWARERGKRGSLVMSENTKSGKKKSK